MTGEWRHVYRCGVDRDGSRRWFFARAMVDDILERSGCDHNGSYHRQLAELFAEDYAALNGVDVSEVSAFPRPTRPMLRALSADIKRRFEPKTIEYHGVVRRARGTTSHLLRLRTWTFLDARLDGPPGRRNDFDLYVLRPGGRKPVAKSIRRGSREHIDRVLPPGRYRLVTHTARGRGPYRIRVDLD